VDKLKLAGQQLHRPALDGNGCHIFQMSANNGAFPRRCGQSYDGRPCNVVVPSEQAYRRHLVRYHRLQLVVRHVAADERIERLVAIPAEEARRRIRMLNCRQGGRADERCRRRDGHDRFRDVHSGGHHLRPPSSSAAGDGHPGPSRRGSSRDSS